MSPPGRPKGESQSAQREGRPVSPPGRSKGESQSAQREGRPVNSVASAVQRRAAAALRQERDLAEVLLATADALIIVRDAAGRIERFNRACEEVSGLASEEVRGQAIAGSRWLRPEAAQAVQRAFDSVRTSRSPMRLENRWQRRGGRERTIAWSMSGLFDDAGRLQHVISIGVDVTEQREAERLAQQRQEELFHLNRVHTAGSLAASVAHELNQPLAALVGFCEASLAMLQAGNAPLGKLTENLRRTLEQAHRAAEIVREMRGFLARDSVAKGSLDLAVALGAALRLLESEAHAAGVELSLQIEPGLAPVRAGRFHVEQVTVNLVRNGVEAIVASGARKGRVSVIARAADDSAHVSVHDTGPGFDATTMQHLFEPFYTTRPNGLGLGLPISRSIVEAQGGQLWPEAAEGSAGGRIHFTLPLAR